MQIAGDIGEVLGGYLDDPTLADATLDRVVHSSHKIDLKGNQYRRKRRPPPPWISLRCTPRRTPDQSLRASAFQVDRGRLRYIDHFACAHPPRVHDDAQTPSTISLKQASTIAEMRTCVRLFYELTD